MNIVLKKGTGTKVYFINGWFSFFTANEYRSQIFGVSPAALGGRRCWSLCTCSLSWPGCSHCWSAPRGSWVSSFEGRDRFRRHMQRPWSCVSGGIEAGCHWRHRPHTAGWREPQCHNHSVWFKVIMCWNYDTSHHINLFNVQTGLEIHPTFA